MNKQERENDGVIRVEKGHKQWNIQHIRCLFFRAIQEKIVPEINSRQQPAIL